MKRRRALTLLGGTLAACSAGGSSNPLLVAKAPSADGLGLNVGTELNWRNWRDQLFPLYKAAGIRWLRVWYNWASLEQEPGVYGDPTTMEGLQFAKGLDFNVLFVIWGTPSHAGSGDLGAVPQPEALANYCRWLRQDLSGLVDAWEVGNEPNLPKYYSGSATQYVNTLATAYQVLKGDKPVIAAGPSGASTPQYWQALVDAGLEQYCDYVNLHPYRNQPQQVLQRVESFLQQVQKPLWITELGLSTDVGGEEEKAEFATNVLPPLTQNVQKVFWYRGVQGQGLHPLRFGIVEANPETGQVSPLPAYYALRQLSTASPT